MQLIALSFETVITGREFSLSDETFAYGYFSAESLGNLELMVHHLERVEDAVVNLIMAFME